MTPFSDYLPDWLPQDPQKNEAVRAGLLHFGAALMNGRGNLGGILGNGLAAGTQAYGADIQQQQKDALEAGQLKILQNKDKREQNLQNILSGAFGTSATAATAGIQPSAASALAQGGAAGSIGPTMENAARMNGLPKIGDPAVPGAGRFPMTLNQVAALKAAGGADLSAEYKMANEGFQRQQGSTYVMPDGTQTSYAKLDNGQVQANDGSISNAAGYVDAAAETEAAKANAQEGAKANYDVMDPTKFIGADGHPIADTRAGYISKIRDLPRVGDAPPRAPVRTVARPPTPMSAPVTPADFPRITPAEQKARDADRMTILLDERSRTTNPKDIAALDREIALAGGSGASASRAPKLQSASEAKAQVGAVETNLKAGQELNDNWIKNSHNPVQMEGKAAKATLNQLETIKNVDFKTGWGTETKAAAANILGALGVKDAAQYAGNAQKFQQVAMERNMTMLAAQTGPQTEGDSQRAQQTFVKLANTPEANQFIADLTGANARIAARKAEYYNHALPLAKAGGDLTEIDRRWSKIAPSVWSDPQLAKYKAK